MFKWIIDNKEFLTILIALIGLIIGFLKFNKELKINKEQFIELSNQNLKNRISSTTTTFRQDWVQEFRKDISKYYSLINGLGLINYYDEKYLTELSKNEYDLLLRLNIRSEIDKKIELDLLEIREQYFSLFSLLKYNNWDVCDDIIYKHKYIKLEEKRDKAHSCMAKKVSQDMHLSDENNILPEEEIMRIEDAYNDAVSILVRDTKDTLLSDLKERKDKLFYELRIYLKVEWERIKYETEKGNIGFNFDEMYNDIINKSTKPSS